MDKNLEGWYTDPYALHDARWMSEGTPTALVRDGTTDGHDPVPDGSSTVTPVRLGDESEANDGADLRRADDVERLDKYDSKKAERAALDAFDQIRQN